MEIRPACAVRGPLKKDAAGHYAPPYLKLGLSFRLRIISRWNSVGSGYSLGFS